MPRDDAAIQRSIENIRQMSNEAARRGLVSCRTARDLTADRIRVLQNKLAYLNPNYKGKTADRQTLRAEIKQLEMQDQLIAIYESRLQPAQPARSQLAEAGKARQPETTTAASFDLDVIRGEGMNEMYQEGRVVATMLQSHQTRDEVQKKCPRFCTEVLDRLSEEQRNEFYKYPRRISGPLLQRLIGQVNNCSEWRVKKCLTAFRKARGKNSRL